MTEQEWLACTDPTPMLAFLGGRVGRRKFRLFACGCVRLVWHLLRDPRSRQAVETAERYADGRASRGQLRAAKAEASRAVGSSWGPGAAREAAWAAASCVGWWGGGEANVPVHAVAAAVYDVLRPGMAVTAAQVAADQRCSQAALLRDLLDNPFRPVAFDPSWRTRTASAVAQVIYDGRDFSLLPVLADALEDAGCEEPEVLAHCRGGGEHVRGCWVADLVLGKG
jgi:hypothetical protein